MSSLKLYFLLSLLLCLNQLYGQRICASTFNPDEVYQSDNSRYQRYIQLEQYITNYKNSLSNEQQGRLINPNSTIIIPVVVHVVHAAGEPIGVGRNISVAQIQSQIDVLNEDFRRLNADRVNTPNAFVGVASDPNFEFRLACIDPDGNLTDGITRTASSVTAFSDNDDIKFTSTGGHDAWPTDRYLNIWVSNLAGGLLGYAQFPFDYTTSPNTDGVVITTTAFGRVGNVVPPFNDGRTATHEIGHWLDLFHIWGDAVCGDDHCDDTPQQHNENFGCPGFPHLSNCTNNGANGDMFMNYMDYTDDPCMNIFTNDQKIRMRAIFADGGPRAEFINNYFHINPSTDPICTTGQISVTNIACLPVTWTVVSGPASIQGGQNANIVVLQKTGDGIATIRATAEGYFDEIQVTMGTPPPNPIEVLLVDYHTGKIQVQSEPPIPGSTDYRWYKDGVLQSIYHWTFAQIPITRNRCDVGYGITVTQTNVCGTSTATYKGVYVSCDGYYYTVFPNPASSNLTISTDVSKTETTENKTFDEVRIYDLQGTLKRQQKFDKVSTATVNASGLTTGTYLVEIINGKYKERHQVLIQK